MTILIDTTSEPDLFKGEAGRRMVDRCCEHALALALNWEERGMEVSIGYSGLPVALRSGGVPEAARLLAYPAASESGEKLPQAEDTQGITLFLLPRNYSGVLDEFLARRPLARGAFGPGIELIFLYENETQREAAELCARRYGQRGGCRARYFQV
jgi:hypothetical protein